MDESALTGIPERTPDLIAAEIGTIKEQTKKFYPPGTPGGGTGGIHYPA